MRKLASSWAPHKLTEKNFKNGVLMYQENLFKFNEGTLRLSDVVVGDEA